MKVIFINNYPLYSLDIALYAPGTDSFFQLGMGQFIANEFHARNYPITFENWRMDLRIDYVMEKEIKGLNCRIFPSKKIKYFGEYSKELIKALKDEAKGKNVVFHFIPNHLLNYHFFARIISNHNIIATHVGGANPYWKYKNESKPLSLVNYWLEKYFFLKPYNHFITISKSEAEYLEKVKKPFTHMPIFGISREDQFVIKDRIACRKKLGLPLDKKILLQVGRATQERGFDWILELIDHYQKLENYYLVFLGINKEDKYYSELVKRNVFLKEYIYHADLVDYYNAADLLYFLPNGLMDLSFGGTGYVPLESLICGTPVVGTTFHHFPGNEVDEVSRTPKTKQDIIPMIEELLAANISRERCREIVLKYFSWDEVIKKHWELYNQS